MAVVVLLYDRSVDALRTVLSCIAPCFPLTAEYSRVCNENDECCWRCSLAVRVAYASTLAICFDAVYSELCWTTPSNLSCIWAHHLPTPRCGDGNTETSSRHCVVLGRLLMLALGKLPPLSDPHSRLHARGGQI